MNKTSYIDIPASVVFEKATKRLEEVRILRFNYIKKAMEGKVTLLKKSWWERRFSGQPESWWLDTHQIYWYVDERWDEIHKAGVYSDYYFFKTMAYGNDRLRLQKLLKAANMSAELATDKMYLSVEDANLIQDV